MCSFHGFSPILRPMKGILQNVYRLQTLDLGGKSSEAAGLRAAIPNGMLANYDRQRARGKKGIAIVRNHVCGNCRMQVPVGVTASLMAGMIEVCGNCGLYLCLPEPEEQTSAAPIANGGKVSRGKKKTRSAALANRAGKH